MAKYVLDMDMPLDEVSRIFEKNDWPYATRGTFGIPNADDLAGQVMALAHAMNSRNMDYGHQGRIGLLRDPEVKGTFQVTLCVGYLYDEDTEPFADE